MNLPEFPAELKKRNRPLYWFGLLNLAAFAVALVLSFADDIVITGINAWIKPMKFSLSIFIYSWTFGWVLHYLPGRIGKTIIIWGIILCMLAENSLILMQAARGVRSHFNVSTGFDLMIFRIMGMFIMLNTLLILYTIILFFSKKVNLETPMLRAWRSGLIFFFLGGISGGIMAAVLHHAIGGPDDGPGLPFLNWSTLFGDIRSAHFITLHGLQAIPLATWFYMKKIKEKAATFATLFSLLYLIFCIWLHWLALSGRPFIG